MDDSLLTIGSFAELVGLPASALRHYDALGLLSPELVDDRNGYRYYAPTLVSRARLLAGLREAGVGIAEMRALVALDDEERADALESRAVTAEAEARRRAAGLRRLADEQRASSLGGSAWVDGAELAEALVWVTPLMGEPPFDRLLVTVGTDGAYVGATNRYALALRRVRGGGTGRALLPAGAETAAPRLVSQERVDVASLGSDDPGFPDLGAVASLSEGRAVRVVVSRSELLARAGGAEGDRLDVGPSRFTASLLAPALRQLRGDVCVVTAAGPARPHRFVDPSLPAHEIVVMPVRAAAAGAA